MAGALLLAGSAPPSARLEVDPSPLLGESMDALSGGHLIDGFSHRMVDRLPEHDGGVLVEVCLRPEDEAVEPAGDRHGDHGGLNAAVAVADEEAQGDEEREEKEGGEDHAAAVALLVPGEQDDRDDPLGEEATEEESEVEEDTGDAGEPPGEEVPGAEWRGADIEVQSLAAHPEIGALPRPEAALLPPHPGHV